MPFELEDAALVPDCVEVESLHDEGQIDRCSGTARARQGAPLDDAFREPHVERLAPAPQLETGGFTRGPAPHEIVRIDRQKPIAIVSREHGGPAVRVEVRAADTDQANRTDRS